MKRVVMLPEEYQFVYEKILKYMWSQSCGNGLDMLKTQYELVELFEVGVADGKHVLEVTGEDVAFFCDELMRNNNQWMNKKQEKLNREFSERFEK